MNSFGLGLILNFTDNASAGMGRAAKTFSDLNGLADSMTRSTTNSVQAMSLAGMSMSIVGDSVSNVGKAITSVFENMIKSVTDVGTTVLQSRLTLDTLYGSAAAGQKAFQWAQDFAKTSPFNFKDLLPIMSMFKAVGLDVSKTITSDTGATENLLQYASDLAAAFPNIHSMYGTGIAGAAGVLKEYITEGNALSLKRDAGLDITSILGEKKGSTVQARTQQVADLISKIGAVGMTAQLAGTPMQRLSNLQDLWFNELVTISQSGVYDKFTSIVAKISDYLFSIPSGELANIGRVIAGGLTMIMNPLGKAVDLIIKLIDDFRGLVKSHPQLVEMVIAVSAFAGALLVGAGFALKFGGNLLMALSSFMQISQMIKNSAGIVGFVKSIAGLGAALLPIIAIAVLFYIVWKNNLFNVQGKFKDFSANVIPIMQDVWSILSSKEGSQAFIKAWNDISNNRGLNDFAMWLVMTRAKITYFFQGFKQGVKDTVVAIGTVLEKLGLFKGSFREFLNGLWNGKGVEAKPWQELGKAIGDIVGILLFLIPLIKIMQTIGGIIKGVGSTIFGVYTFIQNFTQGVSDFIFDVWYYSGRVLEVAGKIGDAFASLPSKLQPIAQTISDLAGKGFSSLGGGISKAASGISTAFDVARGGVEGFALSLGETLGPKLADVGKGIVILSKGIADFAVSLLTEALPALATFAVGAAEAAIPFLATWGIPLLIIAAVIAAIVLLIVFHKQVFAFLSMLGAKIAGFFKGVWDAIVLGFTTVMNAILSNPIVQVILTIIKAYISVWVAVIKVVIEVVMGFVKIIGVVFQGIGQLIGVIFSGIAPVIIAVFQVIWAVISGIAQITWSVISGIAGVIIAIVMGVAQVINAVAQVIWAIIYNVAMIIQAIAYVIFEVFRVIFLAILLVVETVWNLIGVGIQILWNLIIAPILSIMQAAFQFVCSVIGYAFSTAWNIISTGIQILWQVVIYPIIQLIQVAFQVLCAILGPIFSAAWAVISAGLNWLWNNIICPIANAIGVAFQVSAGVVMAIFNTLWSVLSTIANAIHIAFSVVADAIGTAFNVAKDLISGAFNAILAVARPVADGIHTAFSTVADVIVGAFNGAKDGIGKFFDWITSLIKPLLDGINAIGKFVSGGVKNAGDALKGLGDKLSSMVGLSTGGYVKTTGIAVLHPNEVVVNDDLTQKLSSFLNANEVQSSSPAVNIPAPSINQQNVITASTPVSTVPVASAPSVPPQAPTQIDQSVTFEAGSVVIQLANASDAELEKAADRLMQIIARKKQLKSFTTRK